ncbi:MAG: PTS sugar transporter subunit IIA, partial [Phycisphaerales bacterium]|nr:PTS sugar transporter subunit IIA [Phycisphaerales bacterium]
RPELQGIGYVLAITDNEDLNQLICQRWSELVGREKVFRCTATIGDVAGDPETESSGRVVWQRLPRPSLLSAELLRHEASVIASTMPMESMRGKAAALASMIGDRVEIDPQDGVVAEGDQTVSTLYLRRDGDYLLRAVQPELVTTSRARSMSQLFEEMVGLIVRAYPRLARDETVAELLDRESNFPTALGHGIAVPHAYSHALDTRVCALAQVPDGLDFKAADGEPVRFVFLLLSPEGDPEGHLATLAEIARLVVVESVREELISAPNSISVLDVVRRACAAN